MLAENEHPIWWADYRKEAYHESFQALGQLPADALSEFRRDPGVNREEKWRAYDWGEPSNHLAECWWITNGPERDAPPDLLNCSLVELSCEKRDWVRAGGRLPGAHLRQKYEVKASGILALDQRTVEQLVAQDQEENMMRATEAT